jgi:hypothetical protein
MHWGLLSGITRGALVAEFKTLKGKRMPPRLNELLNRAVAELTGATTEHA